MSLKLFRSVKFNVVLLVVLALASAVGTFLPQMHEVPEKVEAFRAARPALSKVLDLFGLFHVYRSPWYLFLLALMAFDVTVCKLRGLPKDVHGEDKLDERLVQASPLKDEFTLPLPLAAARERVRAALARARFAVREGGAEGQAHLWGARQRLQRWGDFVLHVTLVIILWGSAFGAVLGFEEMLPITAGGVKTMEKRPWTVAVDRFEVEFYENSRAARKYASHLRVVDKEGNELARKRIVVNDPLDIGGVRFYQASWGMTGMLKKAVIGVGRDASFELPWRERTVLDPRKGLAVEPMMMFADFAVTEDGQPTTRGMEPNNPAVLLQFYEKDRPVASVWVMKDHPELCFKVLPDGRVAPEGHPPFRLLDFTPVLFTGLQVAYDPGARIVGWGCAALLFGLSIHFYLHQRRLRVLLTEAPGGARVQVGGWSSRGKDWEPEFRALVAGMKA